MNSTRQQLNKDFQTTHRTPLGEPSPRTGPGEPWTEALGPGEPKSRVHEGAPVLNAMQSKLEPLKTSFNWGIKYIYKYTLGGGTFGKRPRNPNLKDNPATGH